MQYTIYINQEKYIERWLNFSEACVIDVMSKVSTRAKWKEFDDWVYYYIASGKLTKEIPCVTTTKTTMLKIIRRMISKWILEKKFINNRSYYRLSKLWWSWIRRGMSDDDIVSVWWDTESVFDGTPDNITINHNTNIIEKTVQKKKKKKWFIPPTKQEVIDYFEQKWYIKSQAEKAWDYYDAGEWKDSKGNQVRSWKQKMISVWMKPEFKIKKVDKTNSSSLSDEEIADRLR